MARANATAAPVPAGLLHEPLLEQCRRRPDSLAVADGTRTLTFGALYREANALAHALRGRKVPAGAAVAVMLPVSAAQVAAVLGILEAGAAYVPVDPGLPRERIDAMLDLADAAAIVTDAATLRRHPMAGRTVIALDRLQPGTLHPLPALCAPADPACVACTFDPDGMPLAVAITHRGALNTCAGVNERMQVGEDDRVLGLSALDCALSAWDIFGVLGAGGALVLPAAEQAGEPAHWAGIMALHGVTLWNTVPALLERYVAYLRDVAERPDLRLRVAMTSRGRASPALPARLRAWCPNAALYSLAGAAEASIWSAIHPVEEAGPAGRGIPYGQPMLNQAVHVLDENQDCCPVGVPGELCIGGIGVAAGYRNDRARTAQAFATCPRSGARLYRTGDLGRWLPDGTLEVLGRLDCPEAGGGRAVPGTIGSAMHAVPGGSPPAGLRRLHGSETVLDSTAPPCIERQSPRMFAADAVSPAALARQLAPLRQGGGEGAPRCRYASADGLYPVQVYLHIGHVDGIEPGIHYYHPVRNALQLVAPGMAPTPCRDQPLAAGAAFRLFLVASRQAIEPCHGAAAHALCLLEAGAMSHLLEEAALAAGLGLVQLGAVDPERSGDPLALGADALYLHMLAGGLPLRDAAGGNATSVDAGGDAP
jgi:amino acid adenylation domain-containing protein